MDSIYFRPNGQLANGLLQIHSAEGPHLCGCVGHPRIRIQVEAGNMPSLINASPMRSPGGQAENKLH